ncbi:protease IV [Salmonella enterica subsp. diarizonae]|uniref:Protease IV n=1 Tax=Salmonella diarizonae TaxID=59204 RepID=A0A379TY40_SALDZ|nr:protease IV [Salmonella enterica subsp. diarizonae]
MRTLWRFIAGFLNGRGDCLNFVREMVLNLFFIFLVLVGVGIWMQIGNGSNSEQTAHGALLLDISGVIVDKPSTNHRLGALVASCLAPAPTVCRKTPCLTLSTLFVRRKMTVTSPVSFWI